jgi:hypothetical protein
LLQIKFMRPTLVQHAQISCNNISPTKLSHCFYCKKYLAWRLLYLFKRESPFSPSFSQLNAGIFFAFSQPDGCAL